MSMCNSVPAPCMKYVTRLKPPDLVAMHEVIQEYGTLAKITVADDWRRCRWPDTRLALQSGFTNFITRIGGTDGSCIAASADGFDAGVPAAFGIAGCPARPGILFA
eukprot:5152329-Pyramimonas_sp.AAC.1